MKKLFSIVAIATMVLFASCGNDDVTGGGNNNTTTPETIDVYFTASDLYGFFYYDDKYCGDDSTCFAFYLSSEGFNNGGQAFPNASYYYVVGYTPKTTATTLPAGEYVLDNGKTKAPFTIEGETSKLFLTSDQPENMQSSAYTDAKLTVTMNTITLEVTVDGKRHKVSYWGDLTLKDANNPNGDEDDPTGGQDGEAQSTLTADRHVTFDGEHRAKWGYEGDYWNTGYSNYTIYIMNKSGGYVYGDTLQFDLITDNKSQDGDFDGKYTISSTPGKMVMMAGFTNKYAQAVGSWFYEYGGGSASGYKNYAMIKRGSAEFTKNSDGTHTVKLDAYDYLGNNITCNWTGVIEKD